MGKETTKILKALEKLTVKEEFTEKDLEKLDELEEAVHELPDSKRKKKFLKVIAELRESLEGDEEEDDVDEDEDEEAEEEEEEDEDEDEEAEEDEDEDEEVEEDEDEDEEVEEEEEEEEDEDEEEEKKPKKKGKKNKKKDKGKKGKKKGKKGKKKKPKGEDIPDDWKPSIKQYRRLAQLSGVSRIGANALEAIRDYQMKNVKKMMKTLKKLAENAKRETIQAKDVEAYISMKD